MGVQCQYKYTVCSGAHALADELDPARQVQDLPPSWMQHPRTPSSLTLNHPSVPQAQASLLCPPPACVDSLYHCQIRYLPGVD